MPLPAAAPAAAAGAVATGGGIAGGLSIMEAVKGLVGTGKDLVKAIISAFLSNFWKASFIIFFGIAYLQAYGGADPGAELFHPAILVNAINLMWSDEAQYCFDNAEFEDMWSSFADTWIGMFALPEAADADQDPLGFALNWIISQSAEATVGIVVFFVKTIVKILILLAWAVIALIDMLANMIMQTDYDAGLYCVSTHFSMIINLLKKGLFVGYIIIAFQMGTKYAAKWRLI